MDELIWQQNGIKFIHSVLEKKWEETRLSTRPAVTIEWITGINSLLYEKTGLKQYISLSLINKVTFAFIWIIFSVLVYFSFLKLFSPRDSLVISIFFILYPTLNDPGSIVWTDIMLFWTQLCFVLSFFVYQTKKHQSFLFLSGLFLGLAILTKIIALASFFLVVLTFLIKKELFLGRVKDLVIVLFCGLLVFFAFYPASWTAPHLLIDRASQISLSSMPNGVFLFSQFLYIVEFIKNDAPLMVLSFIVFCMIIKYKIKLESLNFYFLLLFLLYFLLLCVIGFFGDAGVKNIVSFRYLLPVLPFLIIFLVGAIRQVQVRFMKIEYLLIVLFAFYLYKFIFNLYFDIFFKI